MSLKSNHLSRGLSFFGIMLFIAVPSQARTYIIDRNQPTNVAQSKFNDVTSFMIEAAKPQFCVRGGDIIQLQRGQYFRGQLQIKMCQGSTGVFKVVASEGTGASPVLLTSLNLGARGLKWERVAAPLLNGNPIPQLQGQNLYRIGPFPQKVVKLMIDDQTKPVAVYPDRAAGSPQFLSIHAVEDCQAPGATGAAVQTCLETYLSSELSVLSLGLSPHLEAVVRVTDWSYENSKIASYNGYRRFRLARSLRTAVGNNLLPQTQFGFFLKGSLSLISQPGEWAQEADGYVYYLAASSAAPTPAKTEVSFQGGGSHLSAGVSIEPKNTIAKHETDIEISDVRVFNSGGDGIRIIGGKSLAINRVTSYNSEGTGILVYDMSGGVSILDSRVMRNSKNGISVTRVVGRVDISNNSEIVQNGFLGNQANVGVDLSGINVGSNGHTLIENNRIDQSGFAAVMIKNGLSSMRVSGNHVTNYCQWTNDCGAVYVNGHAAKGNPVHSHQSIVDNFIDNGRGFFTGTNKPAASAKAVYLDHAASDFVVTRNRLLRVRSKNGAVFIHGGNRNVVYENHIETLLGPALAAFYNQTSCVVRNGAPLSMSGNRFFNNSVRVGQTAYGTVYLSDVMFGEASAITAHWGNGIPQDQVKAVNSAKAAGTHCAYYGVLPVEAD